MRVWAVETHTGPRGLKLREVPDPAPAPGEVLIEVAATGLNRADLLQTKGLYPGPAAPLEVPGLEFSGRVAANGDGAERFRSGDAVVGLVAGEAYAERIAVPEGLLMPVPTGMDLVTAGGLPEVFLTAFDALVLQGGLAAGRRALVHAGGSGVGTAAIQLARRLGCPIAVTCSGRKVARVRELAPDLVIDYELEDFAREVAIWTDGRGVDVILDTVGATHLDGNLRSCATCGCIVVIGLLGGPRAEIDLARLLTRRISLVGSVLRSRTLGEKVALVRRFEEDALAGFTDGTLRVVVDRRIDFADLPEGLEYLATNANVGKVLIRVDETR